MKKLLSVLGLALTLTFPVVAEASSPHFKPGFPVFSPDGLSVTYDSAGWGNKEITAVYGVDFATQCRNHGGNVAPGQNAHSSTTLTGLHADNGNLAGTISVPEPIVTNESAGCPGDNWTAEVKGPIFADLSFFQGGKLVLEATHTF